MRSGGMELQHWREGGVIEAQELLVYCGFV